MKVCSLNSRKLAAAILLFAGCATPHPMDMDSKVLEGRWQCVSAVVDGSSLPDETVQALSLTLTRDRYKTERGSEVLFDSAYTLDPSQNPKHIAMVGTEGKLAGKEALGIYFLNGNLLRICYTMPGGKRPEKFESRPGSKAFLVVWKRVDGKFRLN
jgi:uncharacterized protein (TIGR03067 family)